MIHKLEACDAGIKGAHVAKIAVVDFVDGFADEFGDGTFGGIP